MELKKLRDNINKEYLKQKAPSELVLGGKYYELLAPTLVKGQYVALLPADIQIVLPVVHKESLLEYFYFTNTCYDCNGPVGALPCPVHLDDGNVTFHAVCRDCGRCYE